MYHIIEPNYTQIPNIFLDKWLKELGFAELKILLVIYRKTFGFHKIKDQISLSQLEEMTGLERTHLKPAIDKLIEKKLIERIVTGELGTQKTYYEAVIEEDSSVVKTLGGGCRKDTRGSVVKTPTKETITKENKKDISNDISKNVPNAKDVGTCFLNHLNKYKKSIQSKELEEADITPNWWKEIKRLLNLHSKEEIEKVIEFAFKDKFWQRVIKSPNGIRSNWERLFDNLKEKEKIELVKAQIVKNNLEWLECEIICRERQNAQGILSYNSQYAYDPNHNAKWSLNDPEMTIKVRKYYENYR